MIYINKDEVQRHIMKWVVICALKKDCIAPPGSKRSRGSHFLRRDSFGGFHRYDQSLQHILVSNAYNHKQEKYHYWSKNFAMHGPDDVEGLNVINDAKCNKVLNVINS